MREIKFRAWDNTNKEFTQNIMIDLDGKTYVNDRINIYSQWREVVNVELMQFTGLKDKNGKNIFERDIVSYSTKVKENGKVQFNQDRGQFEVFWKFGDVVGFDKHWTENELEIIGNIYENPELLERK